MKKLILTLFVLTSLQAKSQVQSDSQAVIAQVFQALSDRDEGKLRTHCSPDLIVVEDTTLWNIDSLVNYIRMPVPSDYKRENSFTIISNFSSDNIAYLTYENQAKITGNGKHYRITWIETAILAKEKKQWKLKALHSTTKKKLKI